MPEFQNPRVSSAASSPHLVRYARDDFPVVAIGASAGGLEAFQKFFDALPPDSGMAFILIQHLDPTHQSLMVELLARHSTMTMRQATDGMRLEPDGVHIIPPGAYLSIQDGALRLTKPREHHGARLPFDFLLRSLAGELGDRAICVVLSGTGADGSLGLKAVKEQCGLVIAQDPDEAGHDGMPRSAIRTGAVDLVLPVAEIPEALVTYARRIGSARKDANKSPPDASGGWLNEIIDLLRSNTPHDFTCYKQGTLQRRIERRMAMAAIETDDMSRYVDVLKSDAEELDLLAKDLLINVTSFFRDPKVFEFLADNTVPDLVAKATSDHPLRIWIAGCSTGEETYSLAMLFREHIAATKRSVKLQVFASDVDPDAVTRAREGYYPESIAAEVSPERLSRFFKKEDNGYRISPELRASVVFTVQDVLADPPFSRLDLISCRNLLIYLQPDAQAKVISLFHFALRDGGVLLLGNSEAVGNVDGRFETISKADRLYRHIGRSRPGELAYLMNVGDGPRNAASLGQGHAASRQAALADLCRRRVVESYAPAAILINHKYECLYSLGPTDRYLRVVPGTPTFDVFAMARDDVRTKLRAAIQRADQENERVVVPGGRTIGNGNESSYSIVVEPIRNDGEDLLLICFVDDPARLPNASLPITASEISRVEELERELETTRNELQAAIRSLEISTEAQIAINDEALSVNEEYQATNEELLTSKEELQSLNEELTALNGQLQETLERQRTTANDLQNILYSTDVATIFLDRDLKIRFFTPATKSLFNVIPGDVGRPLSDLKSLAADEVLLADARTVLETLSPIDREIEAWRDTWYYRRIMPYRSEDDDVEGVVITFTDSTERKRAADALDVSKRKAELASAAKSRFLSVASHDLRQPLQTLALLQGILARTVEGDKARKLVGRLDETLAATSGMLNALLDINRIEAGAVRAEKGAFPIKNLLDRLRDEFSYHTQARGLTLRAVPCGLSVNSDPLLLEQMIRNLLANALKYTRNGKILLGCRRHGERLSIEIWDTGVGIPDKDIQKIFEEYHQLENPSHESRRGLGLGLSIVQRLAELLDHPVRVRSNVGKGSVFAIDVAIPPSGSPTRDLERRRDEEEKVAKAPHRSGSILIVEDEPEVRELLEILLRDEGHRTESAPDGIVALELMARGTPRPDLVLADYNLPNGLNGLQFTAKLRETLHREIPAIILTGDISTDTLREIALQECLHLYKPVKTKNLSRAIQRMLPKSPFVDPKPDPSLAASPEQPVVFVVDDDQNIREGIRDVLEREGHIVRCYESCEAFLESGRTGREACLLIDAYQPGMSGLELLKHLKETKQDLPSIMITGNGDVTMAVHAMKVGALDFIEKPIGPGELLAGVDRALELSRDSGKLNAWRGHAANCVASLTPRQRQIMELVLGGHPSKNIAADLGISQRTVENHRAAIMKKTDSRSLPALARLALAAADSAD